VQPVVDAALARELGRVQCRARIRDPLVGRELEAGLAEELRVLRVDVEPVAARQLVGRDALRRIFRMQVERQPLDLSAVPALEPRRALSRDVAEGSYVVRPDPDQRWHTSGLYPIVSLSP
jgi:hypothetical protein